MDNSSTLPVRPALRSGSTTVILWFALTFIGFVLGSVFHSPGSYPPNNLNAFVPESAVFGFVIGAIYGAILGGLQSLVMRNWIPKAWRWTVWTMLGTGITHAVGDALPDRLSLAVMLWGGGFLLGLLQWLALRGSIPRSGWWMAVTGAAWIAGYQLGFVASDTGWNPLTAGGLIGGSTGGLLWWLLRDRQRLDISGTFLNRIGRTRAVVIALAVIGLILIAGLGMMMFGLGGPRTP